VKVALFIANATLQNVTKENAEKEADRIARFDAQVCNLRQKDKNRLMDSSRFSAKTVRQIQNMTDAVHPLNSFAKVCSKKGLYKICFTPYSVKCSWFTCVTALPPDTLAEAAERLSSGFHRKY